jgi:formate hydrogenlyase subunit 3/multisubunit Na+/H+ antiporter MnhD subunit
VLGALTIAGFPPLSGFASKLTIYLALARSGMWWAAALAVAASILTMVVLVRAATAVFWGAPRGAAEGPTVREVPGLMWAPMAVLAAACVLLGVWPQAIYPLLDGAARVIATVGR